MVSLVKLIQKHIECVYQLASYDNANSNALTLSLSTVNISNSNAINMINYVRYFKTPSVELFGSLQIQIWSLLKKLK